MDQTVTTEHLYPTKVPHISPDGVRNRKTNHPADTATKTRFSEKILLEPIVIRTPDAQWHSAVASMFHAFHHDKSQDSTEPGN